MLIDPKHTSVKHAHLTHEEAQTPIAQALKKIILHYVHPDRMTDSEKANFADTLSRAYKAWQELDFDENFAELIIEENLSKTSMYEELEHILSTGFPSAHKDKKDDVGIITQGPINTLGICPHHLLPVEYEIYVSYQPTPGGMILGLSKLARTCQVLSKRPILQEDLGADIADALHFSLPESDPHLPSIRSSGSAVQVTGSHSCMSMRGAECDALTLTTVLRGSYANNPELKNEFYQAIDGIRKSKWLPSEIVEPSPGLFDEDFDDAGSAAHKILAKFRHPKD